MTPIKTIKKHFFTSHYVPIKSHIHCPKCDSTISFTSHYVPIKSSIIHLNYQQLQPLHPIMFLLNHKLPLCRGLLFTLHPIMFLLNLYDFDCIIKRNNSLHPIMFLLNLNVSILATLLKLALHPIMFLLNQLQFYLRHQPHNALHPIMFLLNPPLFQFCFCFFFCFTSHYVPIKSPFCSERLFCKDSLHPIMFLLNPAVAEIDTTSLSTLHPIMFLLNRTHSMYIARLFNLYIPLCSY